MPNVKKGERITLANTNVTEFVLIEAPNGADVILVTDSANSGTVAAEVAKSAPANLTGQNPYAADKKAFLKVGRNEKVYLAASASGQSVTFEY